MVVSVADPSLECTVFFVCPKTVQTVLLISYLERETGAICKLFKNLDHAFVACEKEGFPGIITWDVGGGEEALGKLESIPAEVLERHNVLLINAKKDLNIEKKAVGHGVDGLIYEDDPVEYIPRALRAILEGQLWLSRAVMSSYIRSKRSGAGNPRINADELLTPKEIEILAYIASGWNNRQIAEKLCLSPNTIKTHIYRIFRKINVSSRTQAALWAQKNL
jgi:LuxR family transcriptional regulator of csgAB operon